MPLPLPVLKHASRHGLEVLTDDALAQQTGVRVAFSGRAGGVSTGPDGAFSSLNLGAHVEDDPACVAENRRRFVGAFRDPSTVRLVVPTQIHGTGLAFIQPGLEDEAVAEAQEAADAVAVAAEVHDAAVLLCFADCVPLVVVAPTGAFAVAHAGWRGAVAGIAGKVVRTLAEDAVVRGAAATVDEAAAHMNVYRGPYIHAECFEVGEEVSARFAQAFGSDCVPDARHVDLGRAIDVDLLRNGVSAQRIADAHACTLCHNETYFSYRGQNGVCGRHGALALREERLNV